MIIELLWTVAFSMILTYVIQNKNWVMVSITIIILAINLLRINDAFEDRKKAIVFMRDLLLQESENTDE